MCVYTDTHSGLMHASGLSAVSWLTAWLDLELQVRAYLSTSLRYYACTRNLATAVSIGTGITADPGLDI